MGWDEIQDEIVAQQHAREQQTLSQFACLSNRGMRRFPEREKTPDERNIRPVFFHDTDRIIHSSAYIRYIDKTQVFSLFENDHITHRVLHVQFVSKIARVIGRCLRLNEDLIEAVALGHDIGHTPFGHDGEAILNEICQEHTIGYFCHNGQSVRQLEELEKGGQGLNLSLQVLDGILAHNGEIVERVYAPQYGKDWGAFDAEYRACFQKKDYSRQLRPLTLEACVVRIADVIGYLGRDIKDAIVVNLLKPEDIPDPITRVLGRRNDDIIDILVTDLISNSYGKDHLELSEEKFAALVALKEFNYAHIYKNPRIKTEEHKIRNIFRQLFDRYYTDLRQGNQESPLFRYFLKTPNEEYRRRTPEPRIVVDFLASMTDDFLLNQYRQYFLPRSFGYSL